MPSEHGFGIKVVIDQGAGNVSAHASASTCQKKENIKPPKAPQETKGIPIVTVNNTKSFSNTHSKKRRLEMMEEQHKYNIKVAKLKIKKLELEISLLEKQN